MIMHAVPHVPIVLGASVVMTMHAVLCVSVILIVMINSVFPVRAGIYGITVTSIIYGKKRPQMT